MPFTWKEDCLLCGNPAKVDIRHPERACLRTVTTLPIRDKLLKCCDKRGDAWASEVQNRLHGCIDLVSAEAVYHANCLSLFMLDKDLNTLSSPSKKAQGRPEDQGMQQWFNKLLQWFESDAGAELYTLAELHAKMVELSSESEVYTIKRLKQKLQEYYKEFIFFAKVEGRSDVVCFRNMIKYIINEKHSVINMYSGEIDIENEADRIITTTAKIIRAEIRESKYDLESYPSNEDIINVDRGRRRIPRNLLKLLEIIVQK